MPLLYRVSLLCYNKSHVPAVIDFTRTDDKGLGATAHELLKEISTKHPKVFSTHVKDLCRTLENEAPTAKTPNPPGAVDNLKACAAFAKKFPKDIPMNTKDSRKLVQAFLNFALYGSPPQAAKHAITIMMNSDSKKELRAKEILAKSIKSFRYNGDHWLTKLAALGQLVLLAQTECEEEMDSIIEIAIEKVLQEPHSASEDADAEWMESPDDDILGRTWAVKILVNRLRSLPAEADLDEAATNTYALLNRLVKNNGEGSEENNTPAGHRSRQRLLAANSLLKLSCNKRLDGLLTPADFVELAQVTHDPCPQVRKSFYTILFYLAHDPDRNLKESTLTWVRSRRTAFAARKETVLETVFARLLSLLAHHPDFDTESEVLKLMSEYILFYLKCMATEDNLSLIFHVAQRVKGVADGIAPSAQADKNLYVLSDLAQALIRAWEEQNGWTMQSWPGKMKLPSGIFRALESHDKALEIAKKTWIDEDLVDELDSLVRKAIRSKKRKATDGVEKPRKKTRGDKPARVKRVKADRPIKTPRKKRNAGSDDDESDAEGPMAPETEPKRKSGRHSNVQKSYIEVSSDEEDAAAPAEEEDEAENEDEEEEEATSPARELSSAPGSDVEMAEQEEEESAAQEEEANDSAQSEPEPEPSPPKKPTRGRQAKKAASPPARQTRKAAEPAKAPAAKPAKVAKTPAKGKAKPAAAPASSPTANGTTPARRSARTRS
jgi:sister-chromatid-cohesion protein PDS5